MKIKSGDRYTKKGITVEVDFVRDGWVYIRKWGRFKSGKRLKSLAYLIRMTVDEFTRQVKGLKVRK